MKTGVIQKGSTVYVVPQDPRVLPYYATVISVGRKYIKILDSKDSDTYDIVAHTSVDTKDGYNCHRKIYASKEIYEREQYESNLERQIKNSLISYIESRTLEELLPFRKVVNQEKFIEQSVTENFSIVSKEEHTHLVKLREYVVNWYPGYAICKKCGAYNPLGYLCAQCGADNSKR